MYLERKTDGKIFRTISEAVADFKCPGPCTPDCPLSQVVPAGENGADAHMCDPEYYMVYPVTVADRIGCKLIFADLPPEETRRYVAVIRASAVRDVQHAVVSDAEPSDDGAWADDPEAEIFLGFFNGTDALAEAARYGCTVPENVRLIPIPKD